MTRCVAAAGALWLVAQFPAPRKAAAARTSRPPDKLAPGGSPRPPLPAASLRWEGTWAGAYARALGLERVLVTCDTANVGSRKVIEANGGEFEDERGGKLRFWILTGR